MKQIVFRIILTSCIIFSLLVGMTGCSVSLTGDRYVDVFEAECEVEDGALTCSPVKAYYSDGSDDEDTGAPVVEGSLVVNIGIANGLDYPKSIRAIHLEVLDDLGEQLAVPNTYDLETPLVVEAGAVEELQCVFSVEKVLKNVSLDYLECNWDLYAMGCVLDGKEPADTADTVTMAIETASFKSSLNYEMNGSIKLKNNYDHAVVPSDIRFWVKTDEGKKMHNTKIMIANDLSVEPGETMTLPFTITASDAADHIEDLEAFDYLVADYEIKLAQ